MLLVRKHGSAFYVQASGKIEPGEMPPAALRRKLTKEIGPLRTAELADLGSFFAKAANEPVRTTKAEMFHLTLAHVTVVGVEIAEARWCRSAKQTGSFWRR